MSMPLSEMEAAVNEAKAVIGRAEMCVPAMLKLCKGRLRVVREYWDLKTLASLKRELRDFNLQTLQWKGRK